MKRILLTVTPYFLLALGVLFQSSPVYATSQEALAAHATITEYNGPETCVVCHEAEAQAEHASVHYQQTGPTPNVPNISGYAGKTDKAFNTYCGTPVTSSRATCAGCHVSNGRYPTDVATTDQLNNVDCMMCHQENYARIAAPPYELVPALDENGLPRTLRVPVEDETGFSYMPNEEKMTISILEAARTVHPTTRATCLRCHAGASGSNGGKRGDMSTVTIDPPKSSDIHMSSDGENLSCSDCHNADNHRVRGRGLDLRPNDTPERFTCARCHSDTPHERSSNRVASLNTHASRVACQTCHIPSFAKDISTELNRDWLQPHYSPTACNGQGAWVPGEIRASNVTPTYKWFDGTSYVYALGQVPPVRDDGMLSMGVPNGWVDTADAKIYPMKEHTSTVAQHNASGVLIPHSTFSFFATGDFDKAVQDGMSKTGMSGGYNMVQVHTYQTINHGVEDEDDALRCGSCHSDFSRERGKPLRMNLLADFGYELKGEREQVCTQCHRAKESKGFESTHKKHVADKEYDCSVCHNFSRPERGLSTTISRSEH